MALSIPLIFEDVAAANSIKARKKVLLENESNQLKELLKYLQMVAMLQQKKQFQLQLMQKVFL